MIKPLLFTLGLAGTVVGSYFGSTHLGLRSEGWREVEVSIPERPRHDQVGQNLFTPDGAKVIVTAILPGERDQAGKHVVHAKVQVTNRLALQLFPTRMVHTYAMDQVAVERVIRGAVGAAPERFQPSQREWHAVM